ncbi:MAG: hypothetical protein JWP88_913 [Flaviaesturariibacter sp.]|nr:hypothetical protein [Flaviaesturariibacter sp.]
MKLFFTGVFAVIFCFISHSQNSYALFGGPQATSAKYEVRGNKQETGQKLGGQLGIMGKFPVEGGLYFAPSFNYSHKGYKVNFSERDTLPGIDVVKNNVAIHTMEISPLFHINLSNKPSHFFIQFGPSIDVAVKGIERMTLVDGSTRDQNMPFKSTAYGRITSSAIGRLGIETAQGLLVFAQYTHGLGSLNNADNGPTIRHRIFGISIGKYLRGNPNVLDTSVKE